MLFALLVGAVLSLLRVGRVIAAEDVTVQVSSMTLFGTLAVAGATELSTKPVVLIIAGSGPTDRNGNSRMLRGDNNSLKMLAESLEACGIASIRYDKRGVGESALAVKNESELTLDSFVDDALAWAREIRQDRRFGKLFLLGHSEGALIAVSVAQKVDVAGLIAVASPGRPADELFLDQLKRQLPEKIFVQAKNILWQIKHGGAVKRIPDSLFVFFRPTVQPFLRSLFRFDPPKEIGKLRVPILLVGGTYDAQVDPKDADILVRSNPKAKLVIIEGMNHILKEVSPKDQDQRNSYIDPSIPISNRLVEEVCGFIQSSK